MNKAIYLSLVCIFFSCTTDKKNTLYEENLKGRVKYVKESRYKAEMTYGEIQKAGYAYFIPANTYNVLPSTKWYSGGVVAELNFNKNGYIENAFLYNSDLDLMNKIFFEWDNVHLLKVTRYGKNHFSEERIITQFEQIYNGNRIVESKIISYDISHESMAKYKTNSEGIIEEWIEYDDKKEKRKGKNIISENKIIGSEYYFDITDKLPSKTTIYKYEKGNLKEKIEKNAAGIISEKTIYNISGSISQIYKNDDDVINYIYNKNGDIEKIENIDSNYYKFEYEYDNKGNWIKRVSYKGIKPITIEEREIQYY